MKTIITILIFCLITVTTQIKAQGPVQGSFIINNTMGAFHGTWLWTNGADTVRLYLVTKKVYCNVNGGFYWDCLVGWHLYKKGNTIIESSYSYINDIGLSTILGGNEGSGNSNKIQDGTLKDLTRNKEENLDLTLNAALNQLTWRLTEHQGMRIYGSQEALPSSGVTLPRNIVLTKQ